MKQCKTVLKALIENPSKEFTAKDFQSGKYFVGYEATARMSDVAREYSNLVIVGKIDRYRTLKLNKNNFKVIENIKKMLGEE